MWKKFCAALLLMLLLPACALAEVVISEIMTSNGTYENGHAYDWIELHNTGKSTVDISGWYLSDSKKDKMKFQFPQGTKLKADGYLTVFCTGDNKVDVGKGSDDTLFALVDGTVRFERVGKNGKKCSVKQ